VSKNRASAPRTVAARIAVRRGEFVQLRRRLLSQTWLWMIAFVVGTVLLVGQWHRAAYPTLAAGSVASQDVVVDRDVTLPDPESTEQKRQRASMQVLPVYLVDPGVATEKASQLQRAFETGRANLSLHADELAKKLSETLGVQVLPAEAQALRRARFSDSLLGVMQDVAAKLYRQGIVADRPELLQGGDHGVTLREAGSGSEHTELDVYHFIDGGAGLAETVEGRLALEPSIGRNARAVLAAFLTRLLRPNVVFDRGETLARRLKAAADVDEVVVRLRRGRILVRRGDEISEPTARLLAALAVRGSTTGNLVTLGGTGLIGLLFAGFWYFFLSRESSSRGDFRNRFGGIVMLTLVTLAVERAASFLAGSVAASMLRAPLGQVDIYLPALPHAAGPILAGLMFGLPVAVFFSLAQGALATLMIGGEASMAVYVLIGGTVAAFVSQRIKDRAVLARAGAAVGGVNAVAVLALALWHGKITEGTVLLGQVGAAILGGLVAAALAGFLLPLLESLTGTVTDIRLLELSNPNLPLLKQLASEAPGTFQHSLAMANLAEAAAEAIGANPLLARVCCYYHDIGKLAKPIYFVENQRGENPHDNLTPWMSALVVSNHVKQGLELARQYRLPEPIREAITTHHGTKLIRYFYSRAKEREDADHGAVQESEFRYPGPKPHSKEMGILLLADAAEAAGRTLQDPTPGKIQSMLDQLLKNVLEDGQLDECDLTLKDLEKIAAAFQWVLTNVFHQRIDYPGFDFNRKARAT
jgi:cyclic-di-AMP phosphodiesterase PgpH